MKGKPSPLPPGLTPEQQLERMKELVREIITAPKKKAVKARATKRKRH
jgi:hypothetical protein